MSTPTHIQQLLAEQIAPLKEWLDDKQVTEIMVNPGGHVYVERSGLLDYLGVMLTEDQIEMSLTLVASFVAQDSISGTASSIIAASIGDMRFAGAKRPVCPDGSFFTVRKHQDKNERPTLQDLVEKKKALTPEQARQLVQLFVVERKNLLIAGGTGSGKTTLANAVLGKIPDIERVVTIEDSRELQLDAPNNVALLSNPETASACDLVKLAMRLRPDRLVLGETRGNETFDLLRAFNSGHPGSLSTIHANSAREALSAFEMLFQMSLSGNAQMSNEVVREFIARSINIVVYAGRRIVLVDGVQTVVRKIEQICLVKGVKDGEYDLEEIG
jgi:pilus assembly protein CpaF